MAHVVGHLIMRVLFVSPYIPSLVRIRPYQWIRTLCRLGHTVHLIAVRPPEDSWLEDVPVREWCASVSVFPLERTATLRNAVAAVPRGVPLQAAYSHHPEAEAAVAAAARQCDVVHVEHLRGAVLADAVSDTPRVLDAVDSIAALFEQARTRATSWKHRLMASVDVGRTRRFEGQLARRFDRVVVASTRDAAVFHSLSPASARERIVSIPNGVDAEYWQPDIQRSSAKTILFTGKMSYHANETAALRLLGRIMPIVWRSLPDAHVVLAGLDPSPDVRAHAADSRVTVTGYVPDLRPHFHAARLVMAPLEYGVGIQNKVLEAMASGVPVVASNAACEGIGAVPDRDLLAGETDEELAAHAVALFGDEHRRQALARSGRRYVVANHDWVTLSQRLVAVYQDACAMRASRPKGVLEGAAG
ncbi:MAG: glycosyltransferase [Vicinamibacterales bacterium]